MALIAPGWTSPGHGKARLAITGAFAAMFLLEAWAIAAFVTRSDPTVLAFRLLGISPARPAEVVQALETERTRWRVGDVRLSVDGRYYDVQIIDAQGQPILAARARPGDGTLIGRQTPGLVPGVPIGPEKVRDLAQASLSRLTFTLPGKDNADEGLAKKLQTDVRVLLDGVEVGKVRYYPYTRVVGRVDDPARGRGPADRLVPKPWIHPLGWVGVALVGVVLAYTPIKQWLLTRLRAAEAKAKKGWALRIRRTLWAHVALGLFSALLVTLHLLDKLDRMRLNVSWLTTALFFVLIVSGLVGRYLGPVGTLRRFWRSFHVPYTILFVLILVFHVLDKAKLGAD